MIVQVVRLHEKGWALPRWRLALARPVSAALQLRDERTAIPGQACRVARLMDPLTKEPLLQVPPLRDAVLVHADATYWMLSGVEYLYDEMADRHIGFGQVWQVTACAQKNTAG